MRLVLEHQAKLLATHVHRVLGSAVHRVAHHPPLHGEARAGIVRLAHVGRFGALGGDREEQQLAQLRRQKGGRDVTRLRRRVGIGHIEGETVGQDALRIAKGRRSVLQRGLVQCDAGQSIWLEEELPQRDGNRVLDVPILCLEMLL